MKSTYMEIKKRSRKLTEEGKQHLIFVYVGGHGATLNEKQIYLLNEADPKKAEFDIEFKLRYLVNANEADSTAHICAVFDCCRVPLSGLKGLYESTGKTRGNEAPTDNAQEISLAKTCKYFQITACAPGGVADADGGFAKKLYDICAMFAAKDPNPGFMRWPVDFMLVDLSPG